MSEKLETSPAMVDMLRKFIVRKDRQAWLEDEYMKVYIRRTQLFSASDPDSIFRLEIANITVAPEFQRRGLFKSFIQTCEQLLGGTEYIGIYIENVFVLEFRQGLERMGFEPVYSSGWQEGLKDCYYSPLPGKFGRLNSPNVSSKAG